MTFRFPLLVLAVGSLVSAQSVLSQETQLTAADRQALLEKLKEVQSGAGGRATQRAGNALTAFRAAAASDDRAHELYLNCVEKVRFEDEKKSSQEFREWKRRHKEREDSPGFRRVLRHQLNWLLLTIEANKTEDEDQGELSTRAVSALDAILGDGEMEPKEYKELEQDVTKTVFALSYGVKSEGKWPASPVQLQEVYEEHILPPLESKKDIAGYRTAYTKWILQEAKLAEAKSKAPDKGERSVAFTRFLVEKRPQMLWDLEKKIYEMGDEKVASLAMLNLLNTYAGNPSEMAWTKEFIGMLEPQEGSPVVEDAE